jgi:pyrrolidone-carboxylate peptidase
MDELTVLLTGCLPFGGGHDPSGACARALDDRRFRWNLRGHALFASITGVSDVEPNRAGRIGWEIESHRPDVVIGLGAAPGNVFRVEREACNVRGLAIRTSLPIEHVEAAIQAQGGVTASAPDPRRLTGDELLVEVLSEVRAPRFGARILRGGFIHVPDNLAFTSQETIDRCIFGAIEATLRSLRPEELRGRRGLRLPSELPGAGT